ncbi:MAG: hypothetical protein WCJ09_23110 [Planctomycetota bacterium]
MCRIAVLVCSLSALLTQLLLAAAPTENVESPASQAIEVRISGGWRIVESRNFRCWCQLADDEARRLAESCEAWRSRLRATWNPAAETVNWTIKCDLYVHPTREAYNAALGRPGDTSVGSTIMNFDQGVTVRRRIDVRADASDWSNAALPHEMTHVILGERFQGQPLPRWADEGIAMLSESADKHRERLENLQKLLTANTTCPIADVLSYTRLPAPHLRDAYYGQSLALTSLLIQKTSPAKFATFIEESRTSGIESALQSHYSIRDIAGLQRVWNEWTREPEKVSFVTLPIQLGNAPKIVSAQIP